MSMKYFFRGKGMSIRRFFWEERREYYGTGPGCVSFLQGGRAWVWGVPLEREDVGRGRSFREGGRG